MSLVCAQVFTQRGFADANVVLYPQEAPNDTTQAVGDGLLRDEVFARPATWIQFAAGVDLRANTHDQVESEWRIDFADRGIKRPRLSVRRLTATVTHKALTVDIGKQFIRWGKTDIITPTDRFAPRDFVNVLSPEFLPVSGVRAAVQLRDDTFEGVWVPRLTPSRLPLLDQRWAVVPEETAAIPLVDAGASFPDGHQAGIRWSHVGTSFEYALSFFDGFNHLPNIATRVVPFPAHVELTRTYPAIRAYGAEAAAPTPWLTLKGEAEVFRSTESDDYILYVLQIERQSGEWIFVGGYAGEIVTDDRPGLAFAPDRGLAKSIVGRASYTLDPRRTVAFESAVRQTGDGVYAKVEYSEARGQHWRYTLAGVAIAGSDDDFIGQYRRNSNVSAALRYSF